ncbi:MAG TPA: hypothetical protein VG389_09700 [Myxococcota bacterium]|jgi:hypothetical protein|nr:hypothetical protein [Myxococcota bacterium]
MRCGRPTSRPSSARALAAALGVALAGGAVCGCPGGETKAARPALPPFHYHPGVRAVEYFPLDVGATWTHAISKPGMGHPEEVLGITRVTELKDGLAYLTSPGGTFAYALADDGILKAAARTYVLKEPIAVGTRWETTDKESFGIIDKVDAAVKTRAGSFSDCLVVRELTEGQELETTYCPRVGPVLMEFRAHVGDAPAPVVLTRAELVAYSASGSGPPPPKVGESVTTLEKSESH